MDPPPSIKVTNNSFQIKRTLIQDGARIKRQKVLCEIQDLI